MMENIKNKAHDDELNKSEETIESTPRKRIGVPKPKKKFINAKVQRLTQKEWIEKNPVILEGVVVYEKDTKRFKMGDGEHNYKDLDYLIDSSIPVVFSKLLSIYRVSNKAFLMSFFITIAMYSILSSFVDFIDNLVFIHQFVIISSIYIITNAILNVKFLKKI